MGTPKFSIPVLDSLAHSKNTIVGIVTQPSKPFGRSRKLAETPVTIYSQNNGFKVFQPKNFRNEQAVDQIAQLAPDIFVIAAYGIILPRSLLSIPKYGAINLHPSLLPKYRGPSPVATAILNGEPTTGISFMLLDSGVDTGPVLSQIHEPIYSNDTTESLTARLFKKGGPLLLDQLSLLEENKATLTPQNGDEATMTKMLKKEDGLLDFRMSAETLERKVRAFHPWPGTYTFWSRRMLKIFDVERIPIDKSGLRPGSVIKWTEGGTTNIAIGTGEELLKLHRVQLAGKILMRADEFSRGHERFDGSVLPT